jgi:putative FmdB family regulatory protein
MPIYEYRCQACGAQKEVLQRMNDAPLTDCAECGKKNTLSKMVTAAGFQLKGTGWYATDFKNSGAQPKTDKVKKAASAEGKNESGSKNESGGKDESGSKEAAGKSEPAKEGGKDSSEGKKEQPADSKKDAAKPGGAGASPV